MSVSKIFYKKIKFIFSIIIVCSSILFSFHSCSFFENEVKEQSSKSSKTEVKKPSPQNQDKKTLTLCFTPRFEDLSLTSARSAYPEFSSSQLAAYDYTIECAQYFSETAGTFDSTNCTITFDINCLPFNADVTVYAKSSGNIIWTASATVNYTSIGQTIDDISLLFQPYASSTVKGEIDLTVETSTGYTVSCEIVKESAPDTVLSSTSTPTNAKPIQLVYSNSDRTCKILTGSTYKIAAGTYTAKIIIYKGTAPHGYIYQKIIVWPGITTNRWYLADGNKHETYTITISKDEIKYYVRAASGPYYGLYNESIFSTVTSSDSASARGSIQNPFATMQYAIDKCTDTAIKYTIICDGDFSSGFSVGTKGTTNTYSSANINIIGAGNNSSAVSTFSSAVNIVSSKNINLENIKVTGVTGSGMYLASDNTSSVFTLTNCNSSNNTNLTSLKDGFGGGMLIASDTTVKLGNGVVISGNKANIGGGIYNYGTLFIYGNVLIGSSINSLPSSYSDAIAKGGNVAIEKSGGSCGGGIYNNGGTVYINYSDALTPLPDSSDSCKINGNYVSTEGGGIFMSGGSLYISGGTFSNNSSYAYGGGIRLGGNSSAQMTDGNISGNKSTQEIDTNCLGGGVYIGSNESFTMSGGIIENNQAASGGGVYNNGGTFNISGSAYIPVGANGKNDVGLNTGASALITVNGTLTPPPEAGGKTATIKPKEWVRGSQVLKGDGTNVLSITDEIAAKFAVSDSEWSVVSHNDVGKINADIYVCEGKISEDSGYYAGDDTNGTGSRKKPYKTIETACGQCWDTATEKTMNFIIYVCGTLNGQQKIPDTITKAKSITLEGVSGSDTDIIDRGLSADDADAAADGSALQIDTAVDINITKLTITGGKTTANGGGINSTNESCNLILNDDTLVAGNSATGTSSKGGGIYNAGTLTMNDGSVISSNYSDNSGGGVYNNGSFTMNGGIIGTAASATAEMALDKNSNYARYYGGGIYHTGTSLTINGGKIEYNCGELSGGGIYMAKYGTLKGANAEKLVEVNYNFAHQTGGGIHTNKCNLSLENVSFTGNQVYTQFYGGAIFLEGTNDNNYYMEVKGKINIPYGGTLTSNDICLGTATSESITYRNYVKVTGALNAEPEICATLSQCGVSSSYMTNNSPSNTFNAGWQMVDVSEDVDLVDAAGRFNVESSETQKYMMNALGKSSPIYAIDASSNKVTPGKIILNNGYVADYSNLTYKAKSMAVGVVFYNGKGLNNDGDTTTTRVLGVGLKTSVTSWCTSDAKAYTSQLSSIECKATGSAGNYTFDTSAIKNGTNNLSKIATALYVLDDTGTKSKYPAFYWAQDYKDVTDSKVTGTDYENGW